MKVYIDLVFLLNVYLDFLILLITALVLKRNVLLKRILLGSIIGGFTILLLFFELSSWLLFIFKLIFSVLMVLGTFSYRDFKYFINNLVYLYLTSIVLGGSLYLLELDNIFLILLFSVLVLYFYLKEMRKIKDNYNNYFKIEIEFKKKRFNYVGYIDSGNKLRDQYKNRPISLIYSKEIDYSYDDVILVPYETASGSGILKCIKVNMTVDEKEYKNSLIGFMDKEIRIDGVDVILNNNFIK